VQDTVDVLKAMPAWVVHSDQEYGGRSEVAVELLQGGPYHSTQGQGQAGEDDGGGGAVDPPRSPPSSAFLRFSGVLRDGRHAMSLERHEMGPGRVAGSFGAVKAEYIDEVG